MADEQVVRVRGEQELAARAGHLFTDVRAEFICAATDLDTWSRPGTRAGIARRMRTSLYSGVTVRKLYTSAALIDEEPRRHLLEIAAAGAQVRISPATLPNETIIVDWRAMVLAGPRVGGDREFTVTTSQSLIEGVRTFFEAAWRAAVELAGYLGENLPHVGPEGRRLLQVLAAGYTDETGARQIGVSVRTYRRRVAELMTLLESDSRFQAGVRAGELGLTA